jgi:hypothetical protein
VFPAPGRFLAAEALAFLRIRSMRADALAGQEHAYLQVLTGESREWKFHFAENPTQAPSVLENRGFEV